MKKQKYDEDNIVWSEWIAECRSKHRWFETAVKQASKAMKRYAAKQSTITYTEVSNTITVTRLEPHDPRLWAVCGQVSVEENAAGNGMLSAIVVHKSGDMEPGKGFFNLAKECGRDVSDRDKCWIEEVKFVHAKAAKT
jgi:hypothetical protein